MSRLYRARQAVVRRVDGSLPAARAGGADEDLLAGDLWLPSARSRVTVRSGYSFGDTPAQSVTFSFR